jgi:SAM-dependent methyltransferase
MQAHADGFVARFGQLDDDQWLQMLIRSCAEPIIDGMQFPAFPDLKFQESFVGASGPVALQEAFVFYQDVKHFANKLGMKMERGRRVLDFGCGWGRNYRFFLKDLSPSTLIGVDVDAQCVQLCQEHFPVGNFEVCEATAPLRFGDETFDVVYAYSVFSHLSETVQLGWVREFSRLLRPGGMLIVTTLKAAHLDVWNHVRTTADHWKEALPDFDLEGMRLAFQSGEFLFCPIGGSGVRTPEFFGEAIISPVYALRAWSPALRLVDYVDDPVGRPQALLVAQKPRAYVTVGAT